MPIFYQRLRKGNIDGFTMNDGDLCPNDVLTLVWLWFMEIWLLVLFMTRVWLFDWRVWLEEVVCFMAWFKWASFAAIFAPPTFGTSITAKIQVN